MNRYVSEMIGTMVLVLMGCGSAVFAGDMPGAVTTGVGTLGVAIAFGCRWSPGHTLLAEYPDAI